MTHDSIGLAVWFFKFFCFFVSFFIYYLVTSLDCEVDIELENRNSFCYIIN